MWIQMLYDFLYCNLAEDSLLDNLLSGLDGTKAKAEWNLQICARTHTIAC